MEVVTQTHQPPWGWGDSPQHPQPNPWPRHVPTHREQWRPRKRLEDVRPSCLSHAVTSSRRGGAESHPLPRTRSRAETSPGPGPAPSACDVDVAKLGTAARWVQPGPGPLLLTPG